LQQTSVERWKRRRGNKETSKSRTRSAIKRQTARGGANIAEIVGGGGVVGVKGTGKACTKQWTMPEKKG